MLTAAAAPHAPDAADAILSQLTLAFGLPGHGEWIILLILGLLIFGRRLPEVGRSLGRGIVEFKKGIKGIEEEVEEESSRPRRAIDDRASRELPREEVRAEPRDVQPVVENAHDR